MPAAPRILLDATAIPVERGGVGRYVESLAHELHGDIVIACQSRDAERFAELAPHAQIAAIAPRFAGTAARLLWEQTALDRLARRVRADVIHSPHYTMPLRTAAARVVTLHDATFFSDPGVHTPLKRAFFRAWTRISARWARQLIVPSRATESELSRYVKVRDGHWSVAPHGVDLHMFHTPTDAELKDFRQANRIEGDWIAFLGTIEPRKNIPALVRAFGSIVPVLRDEGLAIPRLLLAGGRGWDDEVDGEIARSGVSELVGRMGFLPLDQLAPLLGGAKIVCYPSLGEGFGLPVLESMACGAVVVTTDRLALPEVGGDAVVYCDVTPESIAAALLELIRDPARRAELSRRALERAATFNWAAAARAHEAAYARAVETQ